MANLLRCFFFSICFPVACNLPLELTSVHTYSYHDLNTYPNYAKINGTGGYRAKETDKLKIKFVWVTFDTETVVTGVAMQGFGDPEIKEWVEKYYVSFMRQSSSEKFFVDSNGRPKVMGVMATQNKQWNYLRKELRVLLLFTERTPNITTEREMVLILKVDICPILQY